MQKQPSGDQHGQRLTPNNSALRCNV